MTEIYYIYLRRGGAVMAEEALQSLTDAGIIARDDHDTNAISSNELGLFQSPYQRRAAAMGRAKLTESFGEVIAFVSE